MLSNFLQIKVTATENPRVGGSIPPLATIYFQDLFRCEGHAGPRCQKEKAPCGVFSNRLHSASYTFTISLGQNLHPVTIGIAGNGPFDRIADTLPRVASGILSLVP